MKPNTTLPRLVMASAAAVAMAAAGCGSATPSSATVSTAPASSGPATPSSGDDLSLVIGPDGLGPFTIGVTLAELTSKGLVAGTTRSQSCSDTAGADGVGAYAGMGVRLTFSKGALVAVRVDSDDIRTSTGLAIGPVMETAQTDYPEGKLITGTPGGPAAAAGPSLLVEASGGHALLLASDDGSVGAIFAGETTLLKGYAATGKYCA